MLNACLMASSTPWALSEWLSFDRDAWSAENGLMENMQAFLLLLTLSTLAVHLIFARTAPLRLLLSGGILACFCCFIREVDFEQWTESKWVVMATSGWTSAAICVLSWAAFGYLVYRFRSGMLHTALQLLRSVFGILVFAAVSLVIVAALYDRQVLKADQPIFLEELLELGGYFLLSLAAALLTLPGDQKATIQKAPQPRRRHLIGRDTVEVTSAP